MTYVMPSDLYKEWNDIAFSKELFENIVKELKEHQTEVKK